MNQTGRVFIATASGKWFGILVDANNRLLASSFSDNRQLLERHLKQLGRARAVESGEHRLIREMIRAYNGREYSKVDLDLHQVSEYQRRVYKVLRQIPRGKVTSYGLISKAIGSGPRAVGGAVASNRYAPFVPCHRVVPSDMTVGNYSMNQRPSLEGSQVKREMLENEGVILNGDRVDRTCLWTPSTRH